MHLQLVPHRQALRHVRRRERPAGGVLQLRRAAVVRPARLPLRRLRVLRRRRHVHWRYGRRGGRVGDALHRHVVVVVVLGMDGDDMGLAHVDEDAGDEDDDDDGAARS